MTTKHMPTIERTSEDVAKFKADMRRIHGPETFDDVCAERDRLREALAIMLGAAETDCLDDKSNVWRSAMLDARAALKGE